MSKIGLVVAREFNERVRKRSFLITTVLTPLLMVAMLGAMIWIMGRESSDAKAIEVIDASGVVADKLVGEGTISYKISDRTLEQINASHPDTWGALVIGKDVMTNSSEVQLYTYATSTVETEAAIARDIREVIEAEKLKAYNIENLPKILADVKTEVSLRAYKVDEKNGAEKESSSGLAMSLAYVFGFLMYMFVMIYGMQVMQGVIEEKNSKVLEVIASSVRPFELMMGKILGIALVAVTQFVIWVAIIVLLGGALAASMVPAEVLAAARSGGEMVATPGFDPEVMSAISNVTDIAYIGQMLLIFLVYFVGGYLLYAAAFAAIGSAVENIQDAQQFQTPVTLPIVFGFIGMINAMQDPSGALAFWLSIIPFTSPMVMVARLPYGVPAWELALSIALLVAGFVAMVWLAGKIYRVGILMYGKKPTLRELAKWITYK